MKRNLRAGVVGAGVTAALGAALGIPADAAVAAPAGSGASSAALRAELGPQGIVSLDANTGAPRLVARLDGLLSGPSSAPAVSVARDWLAGHAALLTTTKTEVAGLAQTRDYVDVDGTHHVSFAPRVKGLPVYGAGVKVAVTGSGQVAEVVGSPATAPTASDATPGLTAAQAVNAALRDGGSARRVAEQAPTSTGPTRATRFKDGAADSAELTWFDTGHGLRLAWRTVVEVDSRHVYQSLVDAETGDILAKHNTVVSAGKGLNWYYLPDYFDNGAFPLNHGGLTGENGRQPATTDFVAKGWLHAGAKTLNGKNAHVYADTADDDRPAAGDEIAPNGTGDFVFPFRAVGGCAAATPCSWNSTVARSWQTNLKQNAAQVFYFVNTFHDHLAAAPIGFTAAAGNFEGRDAVQAQVDDGAATDHGLPDDNHLDNANMMTRPDGVAPRMQMYLFTGSGFIDSNGGDDASIIYHEYTHGLSNRLVTDPNGIPALDGGQAGAMGEAWSDWYAMDYLIKDCTTATPSRTDCWDADTYPNTKGKADVWLAQGVSGGSSHAIRTQPLDCLPGDDTIRDVCAGGSTPHYGGYTYADYGKVSGSGPEVHADGEIWAETLWQMRQAIGAAHYQVSEDLITRAMELSPPNPSFLEERDAILLADRMRYAGAHQAAIWSVFAQRGMGWSARTKGSTDNSPVAAYDLPPTSVGPVTGRVMSSTGGPVAGATVAVNGHAQLQAKTDASGSYTIAGVPVGRYTATVTAPGFERGTATVTVGSQAPTVALVRDWAALATGARVVRFDGPDLTDACSGTEPAGAFDLEPRTGWLTTSSTSTAGPRGPKSIVVKLPRAVDVTGFAVDPTAPCGATPSAAVGKYAIATSVDGRRWVTAAAGAFTTRGTMVPVAAKAGKLSVRFVRFTAVASQKKTGDGRDYMGVTEVSVHGKPAPARDVTPPTVGTALAPRQSLKALLARGVRTTVSCDEACRVTETFTVPAKTARALRLGNKAVVVGRASAALSGKGRAVLTVKLNRNGALAVRRTAKLPLTATLDVRDRAGNADRRNVAVVLRRAS